MARQLTARQREVLDAIRGYIAEKGYAPSIRDLCEILGISSLRGVTSHLQAIEKKGWIKRESTSRSIRVLAPSPEAPASSRFRSIPLLGTIAAGIPLLAVENVESYVTAPAEVSERAENLFALRVKGDSMIEDHILDGDTIIVLAQNSAEHGDIVAALIGDEATVKRLDIHSHTPRLLPANPNYDPIELAREDARILGKVVGLLRSYQAG